MVAISDVPLLAPPAKLNYHAVQSTRVAAPMTPLQVWNRMQDRPLPLLALAFRIRDAISARFGVKRIGGFTRRPHPEQVAVGDYLDFFLVEGIQPDLLVLTERDKHLDVMTCISTEGQVVTVTSSVVVKNLFGRIYMIPVGLAHRVIVRAMLRRLSD